MNKNLFRPQFNRMETSEKMALMESLAARYNMTFLGLQTFDRKPLTAGGRIAPRAYLRKMNGNLSLYPVIQLLWVGKSSLLG